MVGLRLERPAENYGDLNSGAFESDTTLAISIMCLQKSLSNCSYIDPETRVFISRSATHSMPSELWNGLFFLGKGVHNAQTVKVSRTRPEALS